MPDNLVIVESPAKAKTIGKYLGSGYAVKATVGHIRDLPVKNIGIDTEKGFAPPYVTIPGKEKTVAELKSAAKTAKAVFIATDPDREGEAISWHIREAAGIPVEKSRRVVFHEITRPAIEEAFCSAVRVTFFGSTTPALTRSSYSSVATL